MPPPLHRTLLAIPTVGALALSGLSAAAGTLLPPLTLPEGPTESSPTLRPPAWLLQPGARPPAAPPPAPRMPASPRHAQLFALLDAGDRSRLPRLQRLPNGRLRYIYPRLQGDPPLTLPQIRALLSNPPEYRRERLAIGGLLSQLERLGVDVQLKPPRRGGAAGEWDPRRRVVRIRPDVTRMGSVVFAQVLNHEAIHVAQSCRGGGVSSSPVPLGLTRVLSRVNRQLLSHPLYASAPASVRAVEEEAFANQDQLSLGRAMLASECGVSLASPGRLER